ncbi:C39 family peptidase [Alkalihalobacillus sp. MEB130]|uniref:C39 family peptidase n=1 Tax=Alkalihalobacillus sp. MEB130 TaxID=2976704 RepID=UPI0028DEAE61|nr:C39 family peptidase [Alkalihalobacillus sp. MEB130]MDT8858895.1 C39 family peptidase [Alkalihalobacillus sp. MEB130]
MFLAILVIIIITICVLLLIFFSNVLKAHVLIKKSILVFSFLTLCVSCIALYYHMKSSDYQFELPTFEQFNLANVFHFDEKKTSYSVYHQGNYLEGFSTFEEAVNWASQKEGRQVHYDTIGSLVWEDIKQKPQTVMLDVPLISQLPELPRGCEVTSLAMLLTYAGHEVDKMVLAEEVVKDETPYEVKNGETHFGNPYRGFVGDMYNRNNPGYGVYHEPIALLAEQYKPSQVVDMTGAEFDQILYPLLKGRPIWIITNTRYSKLPDSAFQTWQTPDGPIDITYHEHSVVITGYDQDYIYFNDPLQPKKNRKAKIDPFKEAWIQMGRQAITYTN